MCHNVLLAIFSHPRINFSQFSYQVYVSYFVHACIIFLTSQLTQPRIHYESFIYVNLSSKDTEMFKTVKLYLVKCWTKNLFSGNFESMPKTHQQIGEYLVIRDLFGLWMCACDQPHCYTCGWL